MRTYQKANQDLVELSKRRADLQAKIDEYEPELRAEEEKFLRGESTADISMSAKLKLDNARHMMRVLENAEEVIQKELLTIKAASRATKLQGVLMQSIVAGRFAYSEYFETMKVFNEMITDFADRLSGLKGQFASNKQAYRETLQELLRDIDPQNSTNGEGHTQLKALIVSNGIPAADFELLAQGYIGKERPPEAPWNEAIAEIMVRHERRLEKAAAAKQNHG